MERFESRMRFGVLNLALDSVFLRASGANCDCKWKASGFRKGSDDR